MAATFDRPSVSTELARAIIGAAERKAQEMGHPFVIAIVDDSGVLKAFSRMDGAALLSVQIAQDKAYTAVGFGMPTDAWHEFVKDDPPLAMAHTGFCNGCTTDTRPGGAMAPGGCGDWPGVAAHSLPAPD